MTASWRLPLKTVNNFVPARATAGQALPKAGQDLQTLCYPAPPLSRTNIAPTTGGQVGTSLPPIE
jgi:hypothetical protein